jgi:multidrug resistance efflux pump
MKQTSNDEHPTIESVTEAAELAAARGEWNRVDQYYQQRESLLSKAALSPESLARVLTIDRAIEGQVKVAQAGLASLLDEAAKTRKRIQRLRQWNGALSSDSGTIERHI